MPNPVQDARCHETAAPPSADTAPGTKQSAPTGRRSSPPAASSAGAAANASNRALPGTLATQMTVAPTKVPSTRNATAARPAARHNASRPPSAPSRNPHRPGDKAACSIDGCPRPAKYAKSGWCQTHYHRWWRHGDPSIVNTPTYAHTPGLKGPASPAWVGDAVGYKGAHQRVQRARGLANEHQCLHCGQSASTWAYDHEDPNEVWGNDSGNVMAYSLVIDHYIALCRSCHRKFDIGHGSNLPGQRRAPEPRPTSSW